RYALLRYGSAHLGPRRVLPDARRREPVCRRRVVLSLLGRGESRADDRGAGAARRRSHQGDAPVVRARSFSHCGITVSDFNRAVKFYWEVFGCPLVGVADTPSDRVRSFFQVPADAPACKIGWIRVPGGGVLEIFEFQ